MCDRVCRPSARDDAIKTGLKGGALRVVYGKGRGERGKREIQRLINTEMDEMENGKKMYRREKKKKEKEKRKQDVEIIKKEEKEN